MHCMCAGQKPTASLSLALAFFGLLLALIDANDIINFVRQVQNSQHKIASVNQMPVTMVQADIRSQQLWGKAFENLTTEERRIALRLLIDEELLLQRAESLLIADTVPSLRKILVAAAIDDITGEFVSKPISQRQLLRFYQRHQSLFASPSRFAVDVLTLTRSADVARAKQMVASGLDIKSVSSELGYGLLLPRNLLTLSMLHKSLGKELANLVKESRVGEIGFPIRRRGETYFFQVTKFQPSVLPPFENVRELVEQEYKRRGRDIELRKKLDKLWRYSKIETDMFLLGSKK